MPIRHEGHRHETVAEVRACHDNEVQDPEPHFCESPSCIRFPGCAAYRYDSHAHGYWGPGEEERERAAWAELELAMAR